MTHHLLFPLSCHEHPVLDIQLYTALKLVRRDAGVLYNATTTSRHKYTDLNLNVYGVGSTIK